MIRLDDANPTAALRGLIQQRAAGYSRPFIVALDGRSGAGKSTLAAELGAQLASVVLDGDGFFAGGVTVRSAAPAERARECIDWRRQRPTLEALRRGNAAHYRAFDWEAFDGSLEEQETCVLPAPVVLFEGVYSARPELADLLDLRVLLRAPRELCSARLAAREGSIGAWERQWHEAEDWYFAHTAPDSWYNVILVPWR